MYYRSSGWSQTATLFFSLHFWFSNVSDDGRWISMLNLNISNLTNMWTMQLCVFASQHLHRSCHPVQICIDSVCHCITQNVRFTLGVNAPVNIRWGAYRIYIDAALDAAASNTSTLAPCWTRRDWPVDLYKWTEDKKHYNVYSSQLIVIRYIYI